MSDKTMKFKSKTDFAKYVKAEATKILKESAKIESEGDPINLQMNKNVETGSNKVEAKTAVSEKGNFSTKDTAPKSDMDTKNPNDVKMEERSEGSDGDWATAAAIKGGKGKKSGVNDFADGLANPDVTSKDKTPNVSTDADPTKEGGVPGGKDNDAKMNEEDKEDNQTTPKTQVLGKGTKTEDGFSKGQTDQEINVSAKQEEDAKKKELDDKIETIQLPETYKSKTALLEFISMEAKKLSKGIL